MYCICIVIIAVYLLFFPLPYCPVVPTNYVDAPVIDYVVDDRTPTIELPGKQCPLPSPRYRLSFCTLSIALAICCCYVAYLFNCIACHCRQLLYLSDALCCLKYILYTTVNPAPC